MKKTLLMIMSLAAVVNADDIWRNDAPVTLSDNTTLGSTGGDGYAGIIFTLQSETDRYVSDSSHLVGEDTIVGFGDSFELNSITIQFRNDSGTNKIGDGLCMVVTNTDKSVLGISTVATTMASGKIADRDLTNLVSVTFDTPLTLNTGTQYYAFYVTSAKKESITLGGTLKGEDVASVNLMARGEGFESPSNDFGLTGSSLAITSGNYSPIGAVSVTVDMKIIPEPATATLSLLALAGLAARRRRR